MAASLLMSGPAKPHSSAASGSLGVSADAHAPSVMLPLRFAAAGVLAFVAGTVMILLRPDILAGYHYNQYVISATHLFVLGWILTLVMGATYQLVPVALETRLYSEKLAAVQFVMHVVGFAGMVWMFWSWNMKHVGHFGFLLALGVTLYAWNMTRTLLRVPKWTIVASSVAASVAWLVITVLAGLCLAAAKSYDPEATTSAAPGVSVGVGVIIDLVQAIGKQVMHFDPIGAMHAHAHLGVLGVFVMLIVGVSYRLIPMFTLSEIQCRYRAAGSIILLNLGLIGVFFSVLLRSAYKPAFAAVVVLGLALYGCELLLIIRARKRRSLDWGVKQFLTAVSLLLPVAAIGAVLSWPKLPVTQFTGQLENLYGFLAITGVVTGAIIGMLYKIIPFIVWYTSYSKLVGRCKVPCLGDLFSTRIQAAGYWLWLAGLATSAAGILLSQNGIVRCGTGLQLLTAFCLLTNAGKMLSHLRKPQTMPLQAGTAQRLTMSAMSQIAASKT